VSGRTCANQYGERCLSCSNGASRRVLGLLGIMEEKLATARGTSGLDKESGQGTPGQGTEKGKGRIKSGKKTGRQRESCQELREIGDLYGAGWHWILGFFLIPDITGTAMPYKTS
jgi:hypothetical protein